MTHVDAGHELEQFGRHVLGGADAARGEVELPRMGFGIGNEFRNGVDRNGRMHLQHVRYRKGAVDGRKIADEIEIEVLIKRRVDGVGGSTPQKRIAVWRLARDELGRDIAGRAGPVVEYKRLAELFGQPLTYETADRIG